MHPTEGVLSPEDPAPATLDVKGDEVRVRLARRRGRVAHVLWRGDGCVLESAVPC